MERFEGVIADIELPDIIQLHAISRASTCLVVEADGQVGKIYFEQGEVIHAELNGTEGEKAFYRIMAFQSGKVRSEEGVRPQRRTINAKVTALLIEAVRQRDEEEAGKKGSESNDELNAEQHDSVPKTASVDASSNKACDEEDEMTGLKEILGTFTEIPGVNTACLVGRDGFLVESVTMAGVDAEMIGAIASSGFGAAEAMGGQLGKGGLSLSMIEFENGPIMLAPVGEDAFLVIVADQNSNLGLIRLKIRRSAKELEKAAAI